MKANKLIDIIKNKPIKALMLFYAVIIGAAAAISLLIGIGIFAAHCFGYYEEKALNLSDFEQIGIEQINEKTLVNATSDAQLIYRQNVHNLYVKCSFSYNPGEFVLFYSHSSEGNFGINKMLYAKRQGDYYVFKLPLGTKSIRLDTGIHPSITVDFSEIVVNKSSFWDYFRVSIGSLFGLFILPPILYGLVSLFIDLLDKLRRKFSARA